jgi:hypothetical protein
MNVFWSDEQAKNVPKVPKKNIIVFANLRDDAFILRILNLFIFVYINPFRVSPVNFNPILP